MNTSTDSPSPMVPNTRPLANEIDLSVYWIALLQSKWLITLIVFAALAMAFVYLLVASPVYRVNAILQLETGRSELGALEDISSLLGMESVEALAELEVIRSRSIIGRTVEELNLGLSVQPRYFPFIGSVVARYYRDETPAPALWGLNKFAWGGELIRIAQIKVGRTYQNQTLRLVAGEEHTYALYTPEDQFLLSGKVGVLEKSGEAEADRVDLLIEELHARPGTGFLLTQQSATLTTEAYQKAIKISEKVKNSGIIEVVLKGTDASKITDIVNTLVRIYFTQHVERRTQEVEQMLTFVDSQLPVFKANLDAAEAALNIHHRKYGSIDIDLKTRTLVAKLSEVENQISDLQLVLVDYRRKYTKEHPNLVNLEQKIYQLRKEKADIDRRIDALPEAELASVRVMRDFKTASDVYAMLLTKAQELSIAKSGILGNVRVVDWAVLPEKRIAPKPPLILAGTVFFGLFVGVFIALLRKSLDAGIDDPEIIEQQLGLPVYGLIPHSLQQSKLPPKSKRKKTPARIPLLAHYNSSDPVLESLRSLRTSLQFSLMNEATPSVVSINGPTLNVGKSFIAANLSYLFAETGKKNLLIDADMRKGHLHHFLGIAKTPGLSDFIRADAELEQVLHSVDIGTEDQNLQFSFIPAGSLPPRPADLLVHERFTHLVESLGRQFDLIVLDTPAVLAVADAAIVSRLTDINLLVVRAGQQRLEEVEWSLKRFQQSGAKLHGVVFNDVSPRGGYGYGYNYRYYKYYKYGY